MAYINFNFTTPNYSPPYPTNFNFGEEEDVLGEFYVLIGSIWKSVEPKILVDSQWKSVSNVDIIVNGSWKNII